MYACGQRLDENIKNEIFTLDYGWNFFMCGIYKFSLILLWHCFTVNTTNNSFKALKLQID